MIPWRLPPRSPAEFPRQTRRARRAATGRSKRFASTMDLRFHEEPPRSSSRTGMPEAKDSQPFRASCELPSFEVSRASRCRRSVATEVWRHFRRASRGPSRQVSLGGEEPRSGMTNRPRPPTHHDPAKGHRLPEGLGCFSPIVHLTTMGFTPRRTGFGPSCHAALAGIATGRPAPFLLLPSASP